MKNFLSLVWRFKRAFLKLHYVQEYPVLSIGPLKDFLLGKIQYKGQLAGNVAVAASPGHESSETTRGAT